MATQKVIAAPMTALSRTFQKNFKKGGAVKTKKYQAGGPIDPVKAIDTFKKTVKPPKSIRGPKQSPSDMRQPYGPSQKPVGPGNTAKTPKPYRKAKPSTPASMMKPMKKGGAMKSKKG